MSDGATTSTPASAWLSACFERFVVHHVAGVVDQSVLAVTGVGIKRHVGNDAEVRKARLEAAHHGGHEPLGIPRLFGLLALLVGLDHREQRQCRHAEFKRLFGHAEQQIERKALDARH